MNYENSFNELSRIFAGWSVFISKSLMGFFGTLAFLIDLYHIHDLLITKTPVPQYKTRLATHGMGFLVNSLYTVAAVIGNVFSLIGLGFVGLASDVISLLRSSYILHATRMEASTSKEALTKLENDYQWLVDDAAAQQKEKIQKLSERRELIREMRFQYKVDTFFSTLSVIASGLFIGGLLFPPLMIASMALFFAAKGIQTLDTYYHYRISGAFCSLFASPKDITNISEQYKRMDQEDYMEEPITNVLNGYCSTTKIAQILPYTDESAIDVDDHVLVSSDIYDSSTISSTSAVVYSFEPKREDIINPSSAISADDAIDIVVPANLSR